MSCRGPFAKLITDMMLDGPFGNWGMAQACPYIPFLVPLQDSKL